MELFAAFFGKGKAHDRPASDRHATPADTVGRPVELIAGNDARGRHANGTPRLDFDEFLRRAADADSVVIDTETVGPGRDIEIFEFGALLLRQGDVIHRYDQLIRPSRPLDGANAALCAIRDDDLLDAPSIGFVLPPIIDAISPLTFIGHNVPYNLMALNTEAARCGAPPLHPNAVDTLEMARMLFPDAPHHSLQDVMRMLGIDRPERHRALADAEDTFEVWSLMMRMDSPRYFDLTEIEMHRAASDREKACKDHLFSKAAYLRGKDCTPVNEKPEGAVVDDAEGVEILSDEEHQPILAKYGYDAWLWVRVDEGIIEKGSNYGYPTYWGHTRRRAHRVSEQKVDAEVRRSRAAGGSGSARPYQEFRRGPSQRRVQSATADALTARAGGVGAEGAASKTGQEAVREEGTEARIICAQVCECRQGG